MTPKFAVSYKEPSWEWDESPTEYFSTLEAASRFFQKAVQQDGRFRCIRLEEISASGDWTILNEIDLGLHKDSN